MPKRYNEDGSLTNGVFDDVKTSCREHFVEGILKHTVARLWIETDNEEHFARLEDWMKEPWGFYPPLPPKKK